MTSLYILLHGEPAHEYRRKLFHHQIFFATNMGVNIERKLKVSNFLSKKIPREKLPKGFLISNRCVTFYKAKSTTKSNSS